MLIKTVSDFRKAMRHGPYAWPGGYPCYFIANDGEPISFEAAKAEKRQIIESIGRGIRDGWHLVAFDINWEDDELTCAHTGERIPSAYGE